MREALLDTSFILTCAKQKIDFLEELPLNGIKILIPEEVIKELEGLKKSKIEAELSLKLLKLNKNKFEKIFLNSKNVDNGIIEYAKKNPRKIIATLDKEIKSSIKNEKMVIRGKKKIGIV